MAHQSKEKDPKPRSKSKQQRQSKCSWCPFILGGCFRTTLDMEPSQTEPRHGTASVEFGAWQTAPFNPLHLPLLVPHAICFLAGVGHTQRLRQRQELRLRRKHKTEAHVALICSANSTLSSEIDPTPLQSRTILARPKSNLPNIARALSNNDPKK